MFESLRRFTPTKETVFRLKELLPLQHLKFKARFDRTVYRMMIFEQTLGNMQQDEKQELMSGFISDMQARLGLGKNNTIRQAEDQIFVNMLELFRLKHSPEIAGQKTGQGLSVGILGCLGAGKSTVTKAVFKALDEKGERVGFKEERHLDNPFWQISQKNKKYMLRSQAHFFLASTLAQLNDKDSVTNDSTLVISDTSPLNDIYIWADWYAQMGHFSEKEHKSYRTMIEFFKPIIPKPDLMIVFAPESNGRAVLEAYVKRLRQGIRNRFENDERRKQEDVFIKGVKKLRRQASLAFIAAISVPMFWGIPVFHIDVDPLEVYSNPEYLKNVTEQIISKIANFDDLKKKTKILYEAGMKMKK